jgi:hypothetical protein
MAGGSEAPYEQPGAAYARTLQDHRMASTTQVIYQPYIPGPRGSLKAGPAVACRSPEEGLRRAERALASGSILGAQVVRMSHDGDADEFGEPEIFGKLGRVPEAN